MNKKALSRSLLFFTFILIFNLLNYQMNEVKAYTTWDVTKLNGITNTQKISTVLDNGKFAYVTFLTTNGGHIYVYNAGGLDGDTSIDIGASITYDISVSSYDVYVVVAWAVKFAGGNYLVYWTKLNTETYQLTYKNTVWALGSPPIYLSNIIMFGGCAYVIATTGDSDYIFKYGVINGSSSYHALGNIISNHYSYGFLDEDSNRAYFMAISLDNNKPLYLYVNLLDTSDFEVLATHLFTTDCIMDYYYRFIGGGVFQSEVGEIYLYYTWAYSDEYSVMCVQHRLHFNSSGIDADNFVEQTKTFDESFSSNYWTVAPDYVNIGSAWLDSKTEVHFYMVSPDLDTETWTYQEVFIKVTGNWEDMGGVCATNETFTTVNSNQMPYNWWQNREWKDSSTVWAIYEDYVTATSAIVYYGLIPSQKVYTMTLEHNPVGEYYTNTQYLMTATLKMNGIAFSGAYLTIKVDDNALTTKETDINGEAEFLLLTNIAGYHTLSFDVIVSSTYEDTLSEYLVFIETTEEDEGQQTTNIMMFALTVMLPIIIVVLVPAFIVFALMKCIEGFLIGLVLGGVVGTSSGILPVASMFLIALLIIVYFVVKIKKG